MVWVFAEVKGSVVVRCVIKACLGAGEVMGSEGDGWGKEGR